MLKAGKVDKLKTFIELDLEPSESGSRPCWTVWWITGEELSAIVVSRDFTIIVAI